MATSGYGGGNRPGPDNNGRWDNAPRDTRAREAWLDRLIRNGRDQGTLTSYEARRSLRMLTFIRQRESRMHHDNGQLSRRDERYIQTQLDDLSARVHAQMRS